MSKNRRIGLKYCGGCNPGYDRVQTVAFIKKRLPKGVELVSYEDPDAEATLVVAGCPTACVNMKPFIGRPIWVITSARGAEQFVEMMNSDTDENRSAGDGTQKGDGHKKTENY